jgi:tetratricopeptide (TPR) repeat protein/pimeloyl-ACP methyl ester carboxylesterase
MKIKTLTINGQKQLAPNTDPEHPMLELKESILITGILRGQSETQKLQLNDNDLLELVFDDDTSWLCPPDSLEDIYPGSYTQNRDGEAVFDIPIELDHPDISRGVIGKVALKVLNLFTKKKVGDKVEAFARDLEEKQLGNHKGLVRIDGSFELGKVEGLNPQQPVLLFIHGTNSSTRGSFSELLGSELWKFIVQAYDKNILAFQHETLTKSPLQNAFELVEQLPQNSDLHIITHSRGGLVGEILCRFSGSSGPSPGFSGQEIEALLDEKDKREKDVEYIRKLQAIYPVKNFRVKKFVRVACPTSGTTILSKRLDHFFNISLNLIGMATGGVTNPIYVSMKNLLTAIIDQKNDYNVLPGLEAMKPDSPFITVLNNQASTIAIGEPVVAISGNCKMKLNLKALVIIVSKLFFFEDNDLVVNTKSMYNGSKRRDKLQYFFDEGTDVDHFHYFRNAKTNAAILLALKSVGTGSIDGFTEHFRGTLGEAERNAVLNLDGGQFYIDNPSGKKPVVVLLPGIMGSNLSTGNDLVWINYLRFLSGELKRISFGNDGIKAESIIKTSYKKIADFLQGEYDVITFPFDWRMPMEELAGAFNTKILQLLKLNQPIKIVGHSMGGVLVRDFMVFHPATWKILNESPGFKLLFLGSPLGGSFRINNVLFGDDDIIRKISKLDIIHSKRGLLKVFSKFPGLLCLLPFSTDADNDFSDIAVWNKMKKAFGEKDWPTPSTSELDDFKKYRDTILDKLPSIDYSNAVYIAGQDTDTPCGYRIDNTIRGEELVFLSTAEGDQSVTWDTGIPKAMIANNSVYYVNHTHGALANAPAIFSGIKDILARGQTTLLSKNRPVVRGEEKIFKKPDTYDFDLSPEGVESTILGLEDGTTSVSSELPLTVNVCNGDLKYTSYPLLAGHFKNDGVLYAEARIDSLLSGILKERHLLGIYPGDIGTSEILLTQAKGFPGAIIVGLGEPGALTSFELARSTEQAVAKYLLLVNGREKLQNPLILKEPLGISSLIIGCGYGGLSIEGSVQSILQGIVNANAKISNLYADRAKLLEQVEFIELYEDRALSCFYSINRMGKTGGGTLNITTGGREGIRRLNGFRKRINVDQSEQWWNRITVSRVENSKGEIRGMKFTISTGAARENLRTIYTSTGVVEQLVEGISTDNNWSPEKARAIFELLIPNDFKTQLKKHGNITWVLDKYTARFPWELLQDNTTGAKPLCINAGMIRQLATQDSRVNIEPVTTKAALVVGDPDLKGFLTQLPGALEEAKMVAGLMRDKHFETTELLRSSAETIVPALFSSNYKIIHLAGHGVFDADPAKGSGMVIGKNNYLTTAEIAQMSTTPELVFVNCCFLGKTDGVAEEFFRERFGLAANIGTQLIENGVKAVIVAGWAVDDGAALAFARNFYDGMFSGKTFGDAVRSAREIVYASFNKKNTWGAYQCYGDAFYKLVSPREAQWTSVEKNYVISEQAEIDLANMLNDLSVGETRVESALKTLKAISDEVDKQELRNPAITEYEAMIYASLNNYDRAIEKFERLLAFENATYSFTAIEKYCNLRAKQVVAMLNEDRPVAELEKAFGKVMGDLNALLQLSPSVERYNLVGSTYKRKLSLYKSNKAKMLKVLEDASRNYYMAWSIGKKDEGVYAFTNWFALENVLVISGKREWGQAVTGSDKQDIYSLPSASTIRETLQAMENSILKKPVSYQYWDLVVIPNIKLCQWILSASSKENGNSIPDVQEVVDSYIEIWKKAGTKDQKTTDIQHLDLIIGAIALSSPEHEITPGLQNLREALNLAIGEE